MEKIVLIDSNSLNEVRTKFIELSKKGVKTAVSAKDAEFNRKIIEGKYCDYLTDIEYSGKNERLDQRDSGLNNVLCKLALKNNIAIGINISKLLNLNKEQKAFYLSRIIQNIKLCRKNKTRIVLVNSKDKENMRALLLTLGMATDNAKYAVENAVNL